MSVGKVVSISRNDQFNMIYIYECDDHNIEGLFENNNYGCKAFGNLIALILIIEDCMNAVSYPHPMINIRKMDNVSDVDFRKKSFRDSNDISVPVMEIPESWQHMEPLVTIYFRIAFRTVSGWQGEAECVQSGRNIKFKSDLEFIRFILNEIEKNKNN